MANLNSIEPLLRDVITASVRAYLNNGGKMSSLVEMSGVSAGAIRRMADGDTAFPRFHTIEAVLLAFGRELRLMDNVEGKRARKKLKAIAVPTSREIHL